MIDTHCHLETYTNIEEILENMKDGILITAGVNRETNQKVLELVKKYPNVYGVIGIQPEEVQYIKEDDLSFIEEHLMDPKIVGVGEIGLDYHYGKETMELQKEVFEKQLLIAQKYNKTIVIHSRESAEDTYTILRKLGIQNKMVLHCYSSSKEMAHRFLEFPMMFGIGGVITFKNAVRLKEVVEEIPLKHLLLETDSPYLTPEPFRGQRNEPYNVHYVANKIAEIKGISLEEVVKVTRDSAVHWFDLDVKI